MSTNPALHGPVLLATDGTAQSGAAVVAARLIANKLGVPLEVVSVIQPQVMYGAALGGVPIYLPEVDDALRARLLSDVRDYVARFSGTAPAPTVHLGFGSIAEEIARVARARSATLVVVGAAPHQRLNHIVAGERAVHVLRASTVPVLSVPPGFSALPQNVLVGIDFAPASIRAAQTALLLLANGGTLTLLHVLSPLLSEAPIRDVTGRDPANAVQMMFGRLRDELRPYAPEGVTIETRIKTDADTDGILAAASSLGADLVAVGTHGPRLLERLFLGSVASSVLHAAAQAVLAVPPPRAAEALEIWRRITGTAVSAEPRDWTETLDDFTRRHAGHAARIEIDDPEIGAQMLGSGSLVGVTYDSHDRRVEIMIGRADDARRHLMHSIPHVDSIAMTAGDSKDGEVLELRHGRGHTLVLVTA
jgi:nucleotide-binding universal stress UspA family protein